MKLSEFEKRLRVYEEGDSARALPGVYIVVRLDGRGFTRMTRKNFDAPYDESFRDIMVTSLKHAMKNSGFATLYGYTQSDEMSILLHPEDYTFGRKFRKINSVLASEVSAVFSLHLDSVAAFDSRVIQLPRVETVVDYFRWRRADARRNALNSWCYWTLRKNGQTEIEATSALDGVATDAKYDLLREYGIEFRDLPLWQKNGIGLHYRTVWREGFNPKTGETEVGERRTLYTEYELPKVEEWSALIASTIQSAEECK